MPQPELLTTVVQRLDALGIDYMISGSIVSSLQGEPRATHDIDIVVNLSTAAVPALLRAFPEPDYYVSEQAIGEALRQRSMFNLVQAAEGEKVDFWILTDEPFDQSRFARKRVETVFGVPLKVSSPEDTILMKLRWSQISGGSEKQFIDALRVFEVQRAQLDLDYLGKWSLQLGVDDLWRQLAAQASPLT
jgi:hypothetical protein